MDYDQSVLSEAGRIAIMCIVLLVIVGNTRLLNADPTVAGSAAEVAEAEKLLHHRANYTIRSPDILAIEVTASGVDGELPSCIDDRYLVSPDGKVDLGGDVGSIAVDGLTPSETELRIKAYLKPSTPNGANIDSRVAVANCNSRAYYVVAPKIVFRMPATGHETVLRAFTEIKDKLPDLSDKKLWIARPAPAGAGVDLVLPIDWKALSADPASPKNYAILPGDRLFITEPPSILDLFKAVISALPGLVAQPPYQ